MKVTVLRIAECGNADLLLKELIELTRGLDISIETVIIHGDEEAGRFGFHGSPTLLVDGSDAFPVPYQSNAGLCCRRYWSSAHDADFHSHLPTRADLAKALGI